jgi:hypothetical protein
MGSLPRNLNTRSSGQSRQDQLVPLPAQDELVLGRDKEAIGEVGPGRPTGNVSSVNSAMDVETIIAQLAASGSSVARHPMLSRLRYRWIADVSCSNNQPLSLPGATI